MLKLVIVKWIRDAQFIFNVSIKSKFKFDKFTYVIQLYHAIPAERSDLFSFVDFHSPNVLWVVAHKMAIAL